MKAPAFLFYTGDFLSSPDVQLMEAHEVGAYCLLLFNSWQSDHPGYLPADEGRLRRTARLSVAQWAESRELLLSKFPAVPHDPTLRYNPRLLKEAEKQRHHRELKSLAGQASAAKRAAQPTSAARNATPVQPLLPSRTASTVSQTLQATAAPDKSTPVTSLAGTCSETAQQPPNLSISLSTLSPLRSERAAGAAARTPKPGNKLSGTSVQKKGTATKSEVPPALAAVQDYAAAQHPASPGAGEEAAAFFDHFQSNGWRVGGKTPMVDWRAAFRNWMRRRAHFQAPAGTAPATPTRARTAPKAADPSRWS
ncbi:DUF1376 domain-containing protein [Hymenobacter sp. BT18]|uniref:DUF1376 domain-containing protein n=1 Tax=Hymenobacter sp. BT18 TaxID=2835648 RepID=UPI00143EC13F|nr:DUF1376 domain-containing protein [Hymenobacter sp. BT18]QIX62719.1 DUF1376 domain-containing protein [Hymenobacter sp. BT18]